MLAIAGMIIVERHQRLAPASSKRNERREEHRRDECQGKENSSKAVNQFRFSRLSIVWLTPSTLSWRYEINKWSSRLGSKNLRFFLSPRTPFLQRFCLFPWDEQQQSNVLISKIEIQDPFVCSTSHYQDHAKPREREREIRNSLISPKTILEQAQVAITAWLLPLAHDYSIKEKQKESVLSSCFFPQKNSPAEINTHS